MANIVVYLERTLVKKVGKALAFVDVKLVRDITIVDFRTFSKVIYDKDFTKQIKNLVKVYDIRDYLAVKIIIIL